MAEVVGLAASIVGLAGAAASVSLTLYDFVGTVRYAREEINALAIQASDLSTVLNQLGAVLNQNNDCIIQTTVETIDTLIKRCERLLEEFTVTIDLVKARATHIQWLLRKRRTQEMRFSLECFKSTLSLIIQTVILAKTMKDGSLRQESKDQDSTPTKVRRHINILRSAVLSNRLLVEKLNAAEETAKHSIPTETQTTAYEEGSAMEERIAFDGFQQEMSIATTPRETSIVTASSRATERGNQLLRALYKLRHNLPASIAINSSLPFSVVQTRADAHRYSHLLTDDSGSAPNFNEKESQNQEICLLITGWTSTAYNRVKHYLDDDASNGESPGPASKEPFPERLRNESRNQSTDSFRELPVLKFQAWMPPDHGRKSLLDCFSTRGGGYVWRHEDQVSKWYYVGEKMVLQYQIRQWGDALHPDFQKMKTVVSKQWVSKDVLVENGYEYTEYGEGSYSIPGTLSTQDVRKLHLYASERTEKLLRRLASTQPKKNYRQMVTAIWDFDAIDPTDLGFKKGDVFEADTDESLGRWQGYKDGASGRFPAHYVRFIITPKPKCKVRALSNFDSTAGSELSFQVGDIIEVEEDLYALRWKGHLNGRQGFISAHRVIVAPEAGSSSESQLNGLISESVRRTIDKFRKNPASKDGART